MSSDLGPGTLRGLDAECHEFLVILLDHLYFLLLSLCGFPSESAIPSVRRGRLEFGSVQEKEGGTSCSHDGWHFYIIKHPTFRVLVRGYDA